MMEKSSTDLPLNTQAWHVEQNGVNPVPEEDRRGSARDVFWIWFAGNMNITLIVVGAVIFSFGLSLVQSLIPLLGLFSFLLVGYFGLPGMKTGQPTMVLSARSFGTVANKVPSLVSWLNLVGWETVMLVIAVYACESTMVLAFHTSPGVLSIVLSLVFVTVLAFSVAFLGHATIVVIQTVFSYLFGLMTIGVFILLLPHVHWSTLLAAKSGSWMDGVVPATTIVIAASGLSWVNTASDYTRYLSPKTSARRVVSATTLGAMIPAVFLMGLGILLASSMPSLDSAANPVALVDHVMPSWAAIPYLLIAIGGIITADILDVYSSGMSLLAMGVKIPRSRTIFVDAVLSVGASLFILLSAQSFIGTFEAFLTLLAGVLAPWAAIFLLDTRSMAHGALRPPSRVRGSAIVAWVAGLAISLATTSTAIYTGPLAVGIFADSSLGFLLGFLVTLVLYLALPAASRRERRSPQ